MTKQNALRGWLLQILKAPPPPNPSKMDKIAETFAFGGGGSGLTPEARELIYSLFSFDYMGAAEYEFGQFPKALKLIADDAKKLIAYEINVNAEDIKGNDWKRSRRKGSPKKGDEAVPPIKDITCYIICRREESEEVERILRTLASNQQDCKASPRAYAFFDPLDSFDETHKGWIDVSDPPGGFFIMKDREMWSKTFKALTGKEP
jgi:hypothetical protein